MPIGARNVALCFSAASMNMVKTRSEVRNISRKTPCAAETPEPSVVDTLSGPGRMALTTPAEAIPANIWARKQRTARVGPMAPIRYRPRVT